MDGDSRWCCTYLLNPSDPLFIDIGEAFIKQQIEGTPDAIYVSIVLAIHLKAFFIKTRHILIKDPTSSHSS